MSDEEIRNLVKLFLKELKSTNWCIMIDDNGNLIRANKPFKNDFIITDKVNTMYLVNIIMSEKINNMKIKVDEMIKEELKR